MNDLNIASAFIKEKELIYFPLLPLVELLVVLYCSLIDSSPMVETRSQQQMKSVHHSSSIAHELKKKKGAVVVLVPTKPTKKTSTSVLRKKSPQESGPPPPSNDEEDPLVEEEGKEEDTATDQEGSLSEPSSSRSTEDPSEDNESSSSEEEEDEFLLPAQLVEKAKPVIARIQKNTPSLEEILSCPLRPKHRAELFELYFVFENSPPNTEERMALRKLLKETLVLYKEEYVHSRHRRKELKKYEKSIQGTHLTATWQFTILNLVASEENKLILFRKWTELQSLTSQDEEYSKQKNWLQWALKLPFDKIYRSPSSFDNGSSEHGSTHTPRMDALLRHARKTLDEQLYGMTNVKEQIILFLYNKLRFPDTKGCCLGLVGDCGVGKTTIARCIADTLHYPFQQISFGGIHSAETLKGFDYTFVGSQPGEVTKCLSRMGCKNGILFFDEFEKSCHHPDVQAFLLHVTDFSQNHDFRDSYLNELSLDLSHLWFICSMNQLPEEKALRDRIFTIRVDGYTSAEKQAILVDFLLPRGLHALKRNTADIFLSKDVAGFLVSRVDEIYHEKGVRKLQQAVRDVLFKLFFIQENADLATTYSFYVAGIPSLGPVTLTKEMVSVFLKDLGKETEEKGNYERMYL